MESCQASQCLLLHVQDRRLPNFSWTAMYCTNKSFYALNLTKKVQPSNSRWQICKADQTSGLTVLTAQGGFYPLVQLLRAFLWQYLHICGTLSQQVCWKRCPPPNLQPLRRSRRPSNTWKGTAIIWCDPLIRPPALSTAAQKAETELLWDTRIWQNDAI